MRPIDGIQQGAEREQPTRTLSKKEDSLDKYAKIHRQDTPIEALAND